MPPREHSSLGGVPSRDQAAPEEFGPGLRFGLSLFQVKGRVVAAIGVKELMKEDPSRVLGPKEKYAICIARIGIAAVNMERPHWFAVRGKMPNRLMGQQENGMRLAAAKELDNLGPQGPGDIVFLLGIGEQRNDSVFCDTVFADIGFKAPLLVVLKQGLFGQDLVKVRWIRTLLFKHGEVFGIWAPWNPVLCMSFRTSPKGIRNGLEHCSLLGSAIILTGISRDAKAQAK